MIRPKRSTLYERARVLGEFVPPRHTHPPTGPEVTPPPALVFDPADLAQPAPEDAECFRCAAPAKLLSPGGSPLCSTCYVRIVVQGMP